jgi:hypothetical protein
MLGTKNAASDLESLAQQRFGLCVLTLIKVGSTQEVPGGQRAGVLRTEDVALDLRSLAVKRFTQRVFAFIGVGFGQAVPPRSACRSGKSNALCSSVRPSLRVDLPPADAT